ncbi:MAG: hypothetical protein QXH07_06285 [Thermoplasmata archaeon]
MTEEYLYDPKRSKRRERRARRTSRRSYKHYGRRHYDPARSSIKSGTSDLIENALVLAGAATDSYLTTKHADIFAKGYDIPFSAAGGSVNVPYTELIGMAGSVVMPFVTRKRWGKYLGKFLTGMGANGIAKIADPPAMPKSESKNEISSWEVITCL